MKFQKLALHQLGRVDVNEFKEQTKQPIIVVLENIRSMHNIGSIFRTCDAFAIEKIYLCGITACPPNKEIHKTALGATESVEWEYAATIDELLINLKQQGVQLAAIEQASESVHLQDFTLKKNKIALIFGNEVKGVEQSTLNNCDTCIEIPQLGTKHSFNVAVTAGIVLWELTAKSQIK